MVAFTADQLKAEGGIVDDRPRKVSVDWDRKHLDKDSVSVDVWVRAMNAADFEHIMRTPEAKGRMVATVARLVYLGTDNPEPMAEEFAASLDPFLLLALTEAINKAAPEGKD